MSAIARPRKGERFEVIEPFPALVLTMWMAPCTGGYERTLPQGFRFVVHADPTEASTAIGADAEPHSKWERTLVAAKDRWHLLYAGYYLVIDFELVEKHCARLS